MVLTIRETIFEDGFVEMDVMAASNWMGESCLQIEFVTPPEVIHGVIPAPSSQDPVATRKTPDPVEDMSDAPDEPALTTSRTWLQMLENLALSIPSSAEPVSDIPDARAAEIVRVAGFKAGALSATLALPPGPLGLLTVIPDLIQVWQLQQQMVADVAACFGKSAQLNRQMMVYCLFRHGAAMLVRDVVARVGERVIVKQASLRVIQQTLRKIGVKVSQKAVGKTLSRWLPIVGPVLIGGYSMHDTRKVGKTAIDTFSRTIEMELPATDALTIVE